MKNRIIAFLLVTAMVVSLGACGKNTIRSEKITDDIPQRTEDTEEITCDFDQPAVSVTDFGVRLLQNTLKEQGENSCTNTLISPMSVLVALSMTANGAKGDTLAQMEATLGLSIQEGNAYLREYIKNLPKTEEYKLHMANSIWFTNDKRFTVEEDFLQMNADYYGADIYKSAFDETTLQDINTWVEEETDGMIKDILDEIPKEAVMYLVNAVAFDAQWQEKYTVHQVHEDIFTLEDGTERTASMMYSDEYLYLEDEQATGFIKYYKDQKYAFVALLPNEGITVREYVTSLTGAHLQEMLSHPQEVLVNASMPKFDTEYDVLMNDVLQEMGMVDVFDVKKADLTGLGTSTVGNIWVNRVIHKTYIAVDEEGTKAGAATIVEAVDEAAMFEEDMKTVQLDRPFVYMIMDCENNQPLFMGMYMGTNLVKCGVR